MKPRAPTHTSQWILDSGAFTAWRKGRPIDLNAYIRFWREYRHLFGYLVNVDVIPGAPGHRASQADVEKAAAQGARNWEYLRDQIPEDAHRLIPVYHQSESVHHLEYYAQRGATYIGLATRSMGDSQAEQHRWMRYMAQLLPPGTRTHGFGTCALNQDASFLTSRDASTWAVRPGYGLIFVRGRKGWHSTHITHANADQALQLGQHAIASAKAAGIPLVPEITAQGLVHQYAVRALYEGLVLTHAARPPNTYCAMLLPNLSALARRYFPTYLLSSYAFLISPRGEPTSLLKSLLAPLPSDADLWAALLQPEGKYHARHVRRTQSTQGLASLFGSL